MINFFIDDSGSVGLNDLEQPVVLFSAICIKNENLLAINNEVRSLVNEIKNDIQNGFKTLCNSSDILEREKSKRMEKFLITKLIDKDFEIHCAEIMRGDDLFLFFNESEREQYLEKAIEILNKNEITIITVYCDKQKFIDKYSIRDLDRFKLTLAKKLVEMLTSYLVENNEKGSITVDRGNDIIHNTLIPKIMDCTVEINVNHLTPNIQEVESHENFLVQLADVAAYISNLYLAKNKRIELGKPVSKKNINRADKFFSLLENNMIFELEDEYSKLENLKEVVKVV